MNQKKILFIIILFASVLRFLFLSKTSLWLDEVASFYLYHGLGFKEIIKKIYDSLYFLPLYNLFMHYWTLLLGTGEFILRLPSVVFGVLTILIYYVLGKRLFNSRVAILSTYILAISPFHIYYSREARMYTLNGLFSIISVYFFLDFLEIKSKRAIFYFILVTILNVYIHVMATLVLLSCQLFFIFFYLRDKYLLRKLIIATLIISIFLTPSFLFIFLRFFNSLKANNFNWNATKFGWFPHYLLYIKLDQIFFTLKNFSLGYNAVRRIYIPFSILFLLLFIKGSRRDNQSKRNVYLCMFLTVIPIIVMFLISKWRVFYSDRYMLPSSLFFYLLVARGIENIRKTLLICILILITFTYSLSLLNYYQDYLPGDFKEHLGFHAKKDNRSAAEFIRKNFQEGDGVFHTNFNSTFPFEYYLKIRNKDNRFSKIYSNVFLNFDSKIDLLIPFQFTANTPFINLSKEINWNDYKRIWLVYSTWIFPNTLYPETSEIKYYPECYSIEKVKQYFDKNYHRILEQRFKGIRIILYSKA